MFVWMLSLFLLGGGNWSDSHASFQGDGWECDYPRLCQCRGGMRIATVPGRSLPMQGELMIDSVTLSGNGEMTTFWDREAGKFDVRVECYPQSDEASGEGSMRSLAIGIEARRGCIAPVNDEVICIIWAHVRHGRDSLPVTIDSVLSCEPREEISCGFLDARGEFHEARLEGGVIVREF